MMTCGKLYIDDKLIKELYIDGQRVDYLDIDGQCVYRRAAPPGSIIFNTVGTHSWTVPYGYTSVKVCMVGGGGGGISSTTASGGGGAGEHFNDDVAVADSQTVTVVVGGAGGVGGSGGASKFHTVTVNGGSAGYVGKPSYSPSANVVFFPCVGVQHKNGYNPGCNSYGVGQGSPFGDGGHSGGEGCNPDLGPAKGGVGAGGGSYYGSNLPAVGGGRGEVRVYWGDQNSSEAIHYVLSDMTDEEKQKFNIQEN